MFDKRNRKGTYSRKKKGRDDSYMYTNIPTECQKSDHETYTCCNEYISIYVLLKSVRTPKFEFLNSSVFSIKFNDKKYLIIIYVTVLK